METGLTRISEKARMKADEQFTALMHHLSSSLLEDCHRELGGSKSPGVDGITKAIYEEDLSGNIQRLIERLKRKSYRPLPVKRVYIPKAGSAEGRPIGIPAYEDKLVQMALVRVLNAIYEVDFLECSYGFRPGRGAHDALKALDHIIMTKRGKFIVDADIKGFFDHVDHEWLMKFINHRIADPAMHRLIRRFLKSGYMETGTLFETETGTPQGGVISPLLANIYLHYALDLWFEKVIKKRTRGKAHMIRYADDIVFCFEFEQDANDFYRALIERLKKFNLTIAEEKTRIIRFGVAAQKEIDRNDKPDTFDFLGFTHYWGKTMKGKFCIKRRTSKKKYRASLLRVKEWLKRNRNRPAKELMKELKQKITGHLMYYGVNNNQDKTGRFIEDVKEMLFKWLNRRSQRKSFNWDKFHLFLKRFPLPRALVYVNLYGY
jgi:group II intron reverse transcriptase/maturase